MPPTADKPGKTVVVTGGNTGLGYETAKALAATADWFVVIAVRNSTKASAAVEALAAETGLAHIEAMRLDLASLQSVRDFAADLAARELPPLRALINNAGLQIVSGTRLTEEGFEMTFGVNHLAPYLLTNLLLRQLEPPARIVFVSSGTHDPAQKTGLPPPRWQAAKLLAQPGDPAAGESPFTAGRRRYATSKLANVYTAYELSRRLQADGQGISVNAFDPGMMPGSGLARDYSPALRFGWNFVLPLLRPFMHNVNTVQSSGKALAALVSAPELAGVTGRYFEGQKEIRSSAESYDERQAADLWEASAELVSLSARETLLRSL